MNVLGVQLDPFFEFTLLKYHQTILYLKKFLKNLQSLKILEINLY